jgi:hypothetical protein
MKKGIIFRTNFVDLIGAILVSLGITTYFLVIFPREPLLDWILFFMLVLFTGLSVSNIYRKLHIDNEAIKFRSLLNRCEFAVRNVASCEYCWVPGGKGFRWYWLKFCDANGKVLIRFMFPGNLLVLKKTIKKHGIKTIGF